MERDPAKPEFHPVRWQFIHIPKCGGMSFRKAFADYERELRPTHDTIKYIPENVRTVAVIRHPLDRLVTICSWFFGSTEPLHEWLDSDDWKRKPTLDVKKRSPMRATIPISSSQSTWIRDETHLILFDDYQRGLDEWCDLAGYPRRTLERRNKSNREPDWKKYLLPRHIERFSEVYAEDFAIYGGLIANSSLMTTNGQKTSR